jgi:hypothetical protein
MIQWILGNSNLMTIGEEYAYRRDIEFDVGINLKPKI